MYKKIAVILLLMVGIFSSMFISSFALENPGTGALTTVVAEVGEYNVVINIGVYSLAYQEGTGDPLFDYLAGSTGIKLKAVGSGSKFMNIGAYSLAYQEHGSGQAIAKTPSLSQEAINNYMVFEDFDTLGKPILKPMFPVNEFKVIDIY